MIALSLLLNLLIFGLFIYTLKTIFSRKKSRESRGTEIRHFFQFGLLFALTIISGLGLSGLLGRALHIGTTLTTDRSALAMEASFTLVGVPLLFGVALWVRNSFRDDSSERTSLAWNLYLTGISIVALILNIDAQTNLYGVIIGDNSLQGRDLANFIVWGSTWFLSFKTHKRMEGDVNTIGAHLIGSLIGLGFSFAGLASILQWLISALFSMNQGGLIVETNSQISRGIVTLLIGIPVWIVYWVFTASRARKEGIWYVYVLLIGVGGGVLAAVISSSFTLYSVLVWFIGDKDSISAREHFHDAPTTLSIALVGMIVVWYHREVLASAQEGERTEIRRTYEYIISAMGLLAAGGGMTMILVSIIESFSQSTQIAGTGSRNTLIAAMTLIIVGAPVWWIMWSRIQSKAVVDPLAEHSSRVRRIYLFILFGVSGVVSVVALLFATYRAFNDLFNGRIGLQTLRSDRFAFGILITALFVALYHWHIYKGERDVEVLKSTGKTPSNKVSLFHEIAIQAKSPEKVVDVCRKYAVHVRKEDGCERFDVLIDPKSKDSLYIYEVWSDLASFTLHQESEGFIGWNEYLKPLAIDRKRLLSSQ